MHFTNYNDVVWFTKFRMSVTYFVACGRRKFLITESFRRISSLKRSFPFLTARILLLLRRGTIRIRRRGKNSFKLSFDRFPDHDFHSTNSLDFLFTEASKFASICKMIKSKCKCIFGKYLLSSLCRASWRVLRVIMEILAS